MKPNMEMTIGDQSIVVDGEEYSASDIDTIVIEAGRMVASIVWRPDANKKLNYFDIEDEDERDKIKGEIRQFAIRNNILLKDESK